SADRQAEEECRQRRGSGLRGVAEQQRELAHPQHLIDEADRAREEERRAHQVPERGSGGGGGRGKRLGEGARVFVHDRERLATSSTRSRIGRGPTEYSRKAPAGRTARNAEPWRRDHAVRNV